MRQARHRAAEVGKTPREVECARLKQLSVGLDIARAIFSSLFLSCAGSLTCIFLFLLSRLLCFVLRNLLVEKCVCDLEYVRWVRDCGYCLWLKCKRLMGDIASGGLDGGRGWCGYGEQ
jgi:hypothetical protein